ncbi:MAG: TonB-dependent receptor [Cephaloticoccus sp.]|nr:TonB-dependent receptor [Cephaloticoccus sp.]
MAASSLTAATISGRVSDGSSGVSLLGAKITLTEIDRSATSTSGGDFHLSNVPAGSYLLKVSFTGYEDYSESVTVSEDAPIRLDVALNSEVINLGEFVVQGTRAGQAMALQQKRSATNITDVVSADALGKFPDGNAAESLRRMPGISVESDQDEGRYVVIRGIDSALNNVTLNSQNLGTPSEQGNRGVAMDSVPADLISRLEVTKAVTPDMDGTAIGGAVNIVTKSAFDAPEGFFYGSVAGFYDSFSDRYSPNANLTYGRLVDEAGTWGVVGAVSYSKKRFQSQTSDNVDWDQVGGYWVPASQESFNYDIMRERVGLNFALQHRPSSDSELSLRVNHNEFTDHEGRQKSGYAFRSGTLSNQTATSGTNSAGRSTREFRAYEQTGTIDALSLSGTHKVTSNYDLSWQIGASRGQRDVPKRVDWEYRSSASAFPNSYDLSGESAVITPSANFYNPASYPFRRVRFRHDLEQEDVFSAQVDLKREVQFGTKQGFWKVGTKFVSREKKDDRENDNYNLSGTAWTLAEPGLAGTPQDSLINREPDNYFGGLYRFGPTINLQANEAFFAANPSRFVRDNAGSQDNSLSGDYEAKEDVLAAYAMASVNLTSKTTVLGGVRAEQTDGDYTANDLRNGVWNVGGSKGSTDYLTVMPGLHVVHRPSDKAVVRFSWNNTLGRPSYSNLAPTREFEDVEITVGSGVYVGSISNGNPELKPFESMNFDLSVEYYLPKAGLVSLGVFHKSIDNPVYGNSTTLRNVTFEGRSYETLSISRPENAKSGEVAGVELNYQQFFTFLPSPLDGLGVNLNYTLIDSEAQLLLQARKVPFFKQSDQIGNFALVYEKYGWAVRVAVAYSGPYITSISNDGPEYDTYIDKRTVIDAKISYKINSRFTVFSEFLNLNEEPLREYTGIPFRNTGNEIYQWKARFGVNWSL